jgi:predicted lipoprotein
MENKKNKIKIFIIALSIVGLAIVSGIYGFTVVQIKQMEEMKISEKFDPKAFVDEIWESKLIPTINEKAVDLSLVLGKIKSDDSGFTSIDSLIPITKNYGLITVGEAHVYIVKGKGKVVNVDTKTSIGTLELLLDGYTGPIKVKFYIGPRIPSDESSVRDSVGFINFGDFREQTEYGKVALEINKRSMLQVNLPSDKDSLQGELISFHGTFMIRTFNLTKIDMNEIKIVPIQIDILKVTQ